MSMNRDNFRANQPPSKVLHIRNLPPDASEQDIMQLCKPYGRVVRCRLNAGQIKHQAFVEFENVNVAMQMIYSFVGSADPPKVRNKTVYLQYSTRQEIGSFGGSAGGGGGSADHGNGSVILIIMDNINVALGPTLDTIHMLCAAFGEVAKIAMFEKTGGLQALVQFHDPRHAKEAQQLLDGSSIPDHLVPQHPGKIGMKVSFSAHADLSIRSQSTRSRDFTNPYLPCEGVVQPPQVQSMSAPPAAAAAAPQQQQQHFHAAGVGLSSSNVLLVYIDNVEYTPTLDALHTVFSTYGQVQKMTIFEKAGNWQALVQYPDDSTAETAKDYLDGHCMYPGNKNKLTLNYSSHRELLIRSNNDRSWDYLRAPQGPSAYTAAAAGAASSSTAAAAAHQADTSPSPAAGAAAGAGGGAWSGQQAAAADGWHRGSSKPATSPSAAAAGAREGAGRQQLERPKVTGQDYERAHNDAARQAVDALGESLAGLPARSSHGPSRPMPPQHHHRPPPPPPPHMGYGPPPGAPAPPGYGPPPGMYGHPYPPAPQGYGYPPQAGYGYPYPGY